MGLAGSSEEEIESRVTRSLQRLGQAPLVIVLCREATAVGNQTHEEITMATQSVALAGLQLLLAAHAEGLGGVWICWPLFASVEANKALALPESWEPQAMFFMGYPDELPALRERRALEDLCLIR
jgi:coenzyme F420-0:L-glutamate ligase/coenzyme F420-1:gamma-L-glutamate ligase